MDSSDSPNPPGAAAGCADLPGAPPDVELNLADDFEAIKLTEDNPKVQAHELAINPDKFVQNLLQRELERRRELAEQERRSQAPSRTSASSRPDTWSQRQNGENEGASHAIAMSSAAQEIETQTHGRPSLGQFLEAEARSSSKGSKLHDLGGAEAAAARVEALKRRSSFVPPEKFPVGFQKEHDANDQVNQVETLLKRLTKKRQANGLLMHNAMHAAGVIGVKHDIQLPRSKNTIPSHGAHRGRSRPEKKKNVETANKWIQETKPDAWIVFSEKAAWIQTREINKNAKQQRSKMLHGLNLKGCSFAQWLLDHGREYGICEADAILKDFDSPSKDEYRNRQSVAQEEESKKEPGVRVSMALNEGVGMMYKGVSTLGQGADNAANTGKFWRPNQNRMSGLQAPTGFHTI